MDYIIKKGILIMTDDNKKKPKKNTKKETKKETYDYQQIRSLSEKVKAKTKKKKETKQDKSAELYKETNNVIDFNKSRECLSQEEKSYEINYKEAIGRKDYVGQIYKDKPVNGNTEDIVFELHKEVVVDYTSYNLKDLVDYTLNILDDILNNSSIPNGLKIAVSTSLKALVGVLSITSIGKWITFLKSLERILGIIVNCSSEVKKFVERLDMLSDIPESSYKDSDTMRGIYSNAFGDLYTKSEENNKFRNQEYTVENILKSL